MWPEKAVHCGCVIYGNRRFCASMTKALVCLHSSGFAHKYLDWLPPRIFQRGLVSTCRLPRRYDLVLDPKCLLVEKGYLSCSILFHSIFAHLTTQRSDRITAVIEALKAEIELAKDLHLEADFRDNLATNVVAFETGYFPRALTKHPAF